MLLRAFFLSCFIVIASTADAQISVPDYSFTGKEITGFSIRPGYTAVSFDFKPPSKMDVYIQDRKSEFNASGSDRRDYSADEPGFMYSGSVSTSVSSIFVGDKAYRNNIVKAFLKKEYLDVISSYNKYAPKLKESKYLDEVLLLYGLSLYETGSQRQAFDVLKNLAKGESSFRDIAQDSLFAKLSGLKRYDDIEASVREITSFSPYAFALWLKYLYDTNRYDDIIKTLDKNKDFEKQYPEFINLRVSALYFLEKYKNAASFEQKVKGTSSHPLTLDALIMTGEAAKAFSIAEKLPDSEVKTVIMAKANIALDRLKSAAAGVRTIKNDNEKLALLFYAVTNKFNKITPDFLSSFSFNDKQFNDYVNFYLGLKYLSASEDARALNSFSLIAFNKELIKESYFYRGMAAVRVDASRAEWNFMRYIGAGTDKERVTLSKFMLSQLYFMRGRSDDALMLADDCSADYCRRLKADIFLSKGMYKKSLEEASGLKDDRSRLIRAGDYYNLLDYKSALNELVKIKEPNPDSEYLLMMSLFKNKRYDDAINILEKNKKDARILSAGVEQLILAGYGKKALSYIDTMKNLPPAYQAERAKLLLSEGRSEEAEKIYKDLLSSGRNIYESLQGLLQIAQTRGNTKEFISDAAACLESVGTFDKKDMFASQFAGYAMDMNEPNLAIKYVNYFMDNFMDSPYLADVYRTRARLFKFTNRYENCVSDAESAVKLGGDTGAAEFIKAECLEKVDKNRAVELYRAMAVDNGRFYQPASGRLAVLSDDPDEVLSASERMKGASPELYKSGIIRFLEISDASSFLKHKESINRLASEGPADVRSVALWRIGKDYTEREMHAEAARQYLKGYYLFPKEPYAIKNLESAKASYDVRQMEAQSGKVSELLATYGVNK